MILIATDEAGYGPKLGPLVIVATAWRIPDPKQLPASDEFLMEKFAPMTVPTNIGDQKIVVDDSKAIFQPKRPNPLAKLHAAVSACNDWIGLDCESFAAMIEAVCAGDVRAIASTQWLQETDAEQPFLDAEITAPALKAWKTTGIECLKVTSKVVTAREFNDSCREGFNKADLLSRSTLGLVRDLAAEFSPEEKSVAVYCDRHGGRRYYAGVLQYFFDDSIVRIESEQKQQSVYSFEIDDVRCRVHFTVKGDRFTPVAMSSMYAKYIRERMMERFNGYFQRHHKASEPFKPTAGYPTDADRFLTAVQPTIKRQKIDKDDLIRQR